MPSFFKKVVRTIVLRITKLEVLHKRFLLQNNAFTLVIMLTENWNNWIPDLNNLHDNLFLKTQLADFVTAVPINSSLVQHLSLWFLVTCSRDGFQSAFTNTHLLAAEVSTKDAKVAQRKKSKHGTCLFIIQCWRRKEGRDIDHKNIELNS